MTTPFNQFDDLGGGLRIPQRLHELLADQRPREAREELHVLGTTGIGGGDQEGEVCRPVGCAEVDGGGQSGEPDGRLVDVRGPAVGDRDAAGQTGGRLRLPGHGGGNETVAVGGAPGVGETRGEQADDGLLVAARVDVHGDEVGGDDGHDALPLRGVRDGLTVTRGA